MAKLLDFHKKNCKEKLLQKKVMISGLELIILKSNDLSWNIHLIKERFVTDVFFSKQRKPDFPLKK